MSRFTFHHEHNTTSLTQIFYHQIDHIIAAATDNRKTIDQLGKMVATRGMAGGTKPKAQPKLAMPSKAEKAAKAAKVKAAKEARKAERAAAKAVIDAKKATVKAQKDAEKAEAKAAKAARTKNSTKRTPASKTKTAKVTKVTKVAKAAKVAKVAKTAKAKVTKSRARAVANQDYEDEDEDNEEGHDEPQAKRRKIATPPRPYVEVGPPKEKRPAFQIGEWEYTMNTYLPEGLENEKNRPLPHIYIGGTAPQPRWVITQSESIQVSAKRPYATNARSSSRERRDVGGLQWTFEEGDFKKWSGLEYPALYELAYLCLEYTLTDTEVREEIYDSLAQGPLPKEVTKGDTWYPALPPIPITRHFLAGSSAQPSRKSSDATFYFGNYERPNMAVQPPDNRFAQLYPQAVASNLYNRPNFEEWPTASRSPSPDSKSEPGNEDGSEESQPAEPYLERDPKDTFSEPTAAIKQVITDDEGSLSGRSGGSSVSEAPGLEPIEQDTYSEPTTPVSLGNNEHARLDTMSEDGSIFGDDDDNAAQVKPSSARDSREQSPNSLYSGSGSDSEVSASSKTSEPTKVNAADDNSAQSTNSLSPVSHDGLFSPEQIERYYSERNRARLGGLEHHEAPELESQAQPSPAPGMMPGERLRVVTERTKVKTGAPAESNKRIRMESPSTPSTPSPPTTRRKTASEIRVDKVTALAEAVQKQRDDMRAAAAEKVSDKPPVPLLKKTQYWAGARSQTRAPSPEILPKLQDRFLEETKGYLVDPTQRAKHFPDPIAVRRVRVWAGEEMVGHEIKPTVDATLPHWAERHRPFSQWQVPTGITPGPAAHAKVSRPRKRSKGQSKRRPRPASAKEQSVSSARWSSFR
ncbi:hypothetical protein N7491_005124 [Penicillium cf. griseofulvum]|uniref:Uncharacterized protein n=1 Tax=Penicillium cf. griseofulvum TaxID=2972120 RepID=A0A9W9J1B1_9EURO|nr:hypothetical protein N7472_007817 [Penicillium cf. griseofulvum]KAJ5434529.1 hypothetical protein N7491_005124 [Penicillium cf. griseofulvum]